MSHLPFDARAILEYLNELGYRNISAQQLKEFLKGMQPQSEANKSKLKAKSSNNQQQPQPHQLPSSTRATSTTTGAAGTIESQPSQRRTVVKVIKCKKPLCHFKFYLDICDHQLTKRIEEQIKALGGALEFFLTPSVTHFITDKSVLPSTIANNNNSLSSRPGTPQTPGTPTTPQTPYSFESIEARNNGSNAPMVIRKAGQTRADAILNRARRPSVATAISNVNANASTSLEQSTFIKQNTAQAYIVWQTDQALHFFKKVHHELKQYLTRERKVTVKGSTVEPISLKSGFIKVEAIKRNYRPYYQLFKKSSGTEWPKIELTQDDGAFRLSPRKKSPIRQPEQIEEDQIRKRMTRKSRSRSSQNQRPPSNAGQAIKKAETGGKTGGTGHRNSNVGGAICKQQVKESTEKQCGVCEICKIEYDTLTIHLKTKDHEFFAKNSQNFIALDTLIHSSADVNKFLSEDKKVEAKSELEEMEVVENNFNADVNETDPLEGSEPIVLRQEEKCRLSGAYNTPSPTLREKSKRSTKGKHSSEKFQHTMPQKVKSTKAKLSSGLQKTSTSTLEIQGIEIITPPVKAAMPSLRRKPPSTAAVSPPIRAMLPPSSLYKVVETGDMCTPIHKALETGEQTVASPSLIVKFKKVRAAELNRLNGEAESFMFPKRRTSSELPTDFDRQTTSDNVRGRVSSASLDSTSESMDVDMESTENSGNATVPTSKRAIATAKRRKGPEVARKQSFPRAPIQPEIQLKQNKAATTIITTTAAETSIPAATSTIATVASNITLPEATRKSSRTATAIVTAATTSSRLLRAAVEAAKSNNRRKAIIEKVCSPTTDRRKRQTEADSEANILTPAVKLRRTVPVVNMEDRMGEEKTKSDESDKNVDGNLEIDSNSVDEDSSDEQEELEEDDYEKDKDYIHCKKRSSLVGNNLPFNGRCTSNRNQRAMQRDLRKHELSFDSTCDKKKTNSDRNVTAETAHSKTNQNLQYSVSTKIKSTLRLPDYSNSKLLNKLQYAFERLPASDLWYKVFSRQDACGENYFEYYGSTNYRKLPYELGPISFKSTLEGIKCQLCSVSKAKTNLESELENCATKKDVDVDSTEKHNESLLNGTSEHNTAAGASSSTGTVLCSQPSSSLKYTHKHKKLHLLQRYRQEQQELLQKQKEQEQRVSASTDASATKAVLKCDSKASTPDREQCRARERAGSIQSNTSSCASSTATVSKLKFRNKHLSKAAFLNLELPPRKSPREHASTLALVSCIIKQRQDSQSKPNSETDEPPTAPTPIPETKEEYHGSMSAPKVSTTPLPNLDVPPIRSPRNMRSAAATPIEELCFTTEISENVKRMRRGQNKYDHSPPIALPRAAQGRQPKPLAARQPYQQKHRSQARDLLKRRQKNTYSSSAPAKHPIYSGLIAQGAMMPSIRKTGSKKGVLEFEVDSIALKALAAATTHASPRQLEWEIDKYLEMTGKEWDLDMENVDTKDAVPIRIDTPSIALHKDVASTSSSARNNTTQSVNSDIQNATLESNTPPPTDCFSSDFDLYDLFTNAFPGNRSDGGGGGRKYFSPYNSMALETYFRRRKNLKSNRTGWPKVQKRKTSARQQQLSEQKIRFLHDIERLNQKEEGRKKDAEDGEVEQQETKRQNGVITPPESDLEGHEDEKVVANEHEDAEDTEADAADSVPDEDDADTMADSIEEEPELDADAEADEEDYDDGDGDGDDATVGEDVEHAFMTTKKRTRRSAAVSPVEKFCNSTTPHTTTGATSTPSTHMLRGGLRRTPQFNGSLGSCVSPSDKAGDNSDIFTVSSDGLDTDLDLSNSHSQQRGEDEHHHHHNHHHHHQHQYQDQCPSHTPKRKFDLSKYAPNNATSSSCAAEAATAAVKSLAISQFLKKEVRVNCRRIRAPFRRFRYRR